jgi:hypothetical protein
MPTSKPRIQLLLEEETMAVLSALAQSKNQSISHTGADLIRDALELHEDRTLSEMSNKRLLDDDGSRFDHDDAWGS